MISRVSRVLLVACVTLVLVGAGVWRTVKANETHVYALAPACKTTPLDLSKPDEPVICAPVPDDDPLAWAAGTVLVGVAGVLTGGLVLRHGRRRTG